MSVHATETLDGSTAQDSSNDLGNSRTLDDIATRPKLAADYKLACGFYSVKAVTLHRPPDEAQGT
jgi:hypothetical protein